MIVRINPRVALKVCLSAVATVYYVLATNGAIAQDTDRGHPVAVPVDSAVMTAIHAAVFDYFDGINEQDKGRIERAFDTSAQLKSPTDDGTVQVEPVADAIARWMSGDKQSRVGKITSIDITDGQVARVVFDFDGVFVDFLTLVKLEGQWKIVDKVFISQ